VSLDTLYIVGVYIIGVSRHTVYKRCVYNRCAYIYSAHPEEVTSVMYSVYKCIYNTYIHYIYIVCLPPLIYSVSTKCYV